MAVATTSAYDKLIIETSEDGSTWAKPCGLKNFTVNFETEIDEDEIPDCDDESLPFLKERAVRSVGFSVSGEGKWASESHEVMVQWWLTGEQKRIRVGWSDAATGDVEYLQTTGILTFEDARNKGMSNTRNITIQSAGAITAVDAT